MTHKYRGPAGFGRGVRRVEHAATLVLVAFAVFSCATAPAADPAASRAFEFLPQGAGFYFAVEGQVVRELLSGESPLAAGLDVLELGSIRARGDVALPSSGELEQLTNRLHRVYGALDPKTERVFLAVEGDFPPSLVDLGLSTTQEFRRRTLFVDGVRHDYFFSQELSLELYLPAGGVLLLSTGEIEHLMANARRPRVPGALVGLEDDFTNLPVAFLINAPAEADVAELLGLPVRLPIQDVFVGTNARLDAEVMLFGRIRFADEQTAAAFSRVIRFALLAIFADSDIPRAELIAGFSAAAEGDVVSFSGLPVPWRFIEALSSASEPAPGDQPTPSDEQDAGSQR